jgi:hypothetical protein
MAFSISQFKNLGLIRGGARPSLFEVELTFPTGISTSAPQNGSFLIKAAQIPASTVDSVDVGYFGRKIKVAGDRTFNDWTVTVMNDEDFALRDTFEAWSNKINALEGNVQSPVGEGSLITTGVYKCDLIVKQYAKAQDLNAKLVSRSYKFIGAFPTSVDAIALNWDTTNQIEEFDVTFAYDYWIPGPGVEQVQYTGRFGDSSQ